MPLLHLKLPKSRAEHKARSSSQKLSPCTHQGTRVPLTSRRLLKARRKEGLLSLKCMRLYPLSLKSLRVKARDRSHQDRPKFKPPQLQLLSCLHLSLRQPKTRSLKLLFLKTRQLIRRSSPSLQLLLRSSQILNSLLTW